MIRREFLKYTGALAAQSFVASNLFNSLYIENAHGQNISIRELSGAISSRDGMVLVAQDAKFAQYQKAFNMRMLKTPLVRVLCATPQAVATAIQWARTNQVSITMRSGGHSFEGLSQGTGLVIDTRPMKDIDASGESVTVGAGVLLNEIYENLAPNGLTIPAGSGPTVGATGHTLGGGYGMLARPLGLACDSLLSASLVNFKGELISCSADENADLFWALRGGGAGSFGIVTKLDFKTYRVPEVLTFAITWNVKPKTAASLMKTWQQWASESPREITSLMKLSRGKQDLINVRLLGQAIGSEKVVRRELGTITKVAPIDFTIQRRSFTDAVRYFSGGFEPEYLFMKGKSDYLKEVMSDEGIAEFIRLIPPALAVIFDSYGGAISDIAENETSFAHRAGTISSLQYYSQWSNPGESAARIASMRKFHEAMRPYMSGSAYFNYCDLDIPDYATAYWGSNLPRLIEVKKAYDPENVFNHAQSVPLS